MKQYPKIYLAVDNCFAVKRWTTPAQWAKVIADLGLRYVEGSADTELDPLYMGQAYLRDWPDAVRQAQRDYDVRVVNLYSGHGSYATLGLAHTDARVRRNLIDHWFKPLIDTAAQLDAGFGFFAHGFSEEVLQDPDAYGRYYGILLDALTELGVYARQAGCKSLALEQMYSPFQVPWTIDGTAALIGQVSRRSGGDFYFTEDVGHHHQKFLMPGAAQIRDAFMRGDRSLWLGCEQTHALFDAALASGSLSETDCDAIMQSMAANARFFADRHDGDCYQWLRRLGCYSPIVHLQQTDGLRSSHLPFTPEHNRGGIVRADAVLQALCESYDGAAIDAGPQPCKEIYLTLEIFSGTAQTARSILQNMEASVRYWRDFIPVDGLPLDQLTEARSRLA